MGVLAPSPASPSGKEDGLVGGDEAASERSTISRENCANQRRGPVASRSVPDGNWVLGFPGDLRRRQTRHCRFTQRRTPVVCCTSHCHGGGRPFALPPNASLGKRGCLFAHPKGLLCSFPPCGEPSDRGPWIPQGDGDNSR